MTLYQIDTALHEIIERSIDPETGELTIDPSELEALQMAREDKLENIALYYKNLIAEANAVKAEADALTDRRRVLERKAERMKTILTTGLAGEKFSTPRVSISFRKTSTLEIDLDKFMPFAGAYPKYLRMKDPEPDKVAIKEAIKQGGTIPGAQIVEKRSVIVK